MCVHAANVPAVGMLLGQTAAGCLCGGVSHSDPNLQNSAVLHRHAASRAVSLSAAASARCCTTVRMLRRRTRHSAGSRLNSNCVHVCVCVERPETLPLFNPLFSH